MSHTHTLENVILWTNTFEQTYYTCEQTYYLQPNTPWANKENCKIDRNKMKQYK